MNLRLKRYQKRFEYSYANGVFATLELLDARPEHVLRVVLSSKSERNVGVAKLKDLCARNCVPIETNDKTIERLSPKGSHLAIGVFRKYRSRLDPNRNHVVLVNPGDMGNVGTIARTMVLAVSSVTVARRSSSEAPNSLPTRITSSTKGSPKVSLPVDLGGPWPKYGCPRQ